MEFSGLWDSVDTTYTKLFLKGVEGLLSLVDSVVKMNSESSTRPGISERLVFEASVRPDSVKPGEDVDTFSFGVFSVF